MTQFTRTLKAAVVLAPVLVAAACGSDASGGSGGLMFPTCTPAQVITRDANGNLACTSLPKGTVSLPNPGCTATEGLTYDGTKLSCVPLSSMSTNDTNLLTQLTALDKQVMDFGTTLATIGGGKPPARAIFVGLTDTKTQGLMTFAGAANGVPAATAMCNAKYTGSRMCTVYDMYNSVVAATTGPLTPGNAVARSWIYAANWKFPLGTPGAASSAAPGGPQEGTSDNCGSYTYLTAHRKWAGVAVEYAKLQTGTFGLKFHSGSPINTGTADAEPGAPCSDMLPIACCK